MPVWSSTSVEPCQKQVAGLKRAACIEVLAYER